MVEITHLPNYRWNFLISTTASIMDKFVLKLKNYSKADIKQLSLMAKESKKIRRNLTTINVKMEGYEGIDDAEKLLIQFGPNLQNLKFLDTYY